MVLELTLQSGQAPFILLCSITSDATMRIHVWGINYSPEVTGIAPCNTALCEFLRDRGHTVAMITTFFYYPAWKKLPGEENILFRTDDIDDVPVHRCWHYVPAKATTIRRMIHELSFITTSFLRQLSLPRPDILLVVSPPLFLGFAAWLLGIIKRTSYVFHVQDLQPAAAAGLGLIKSKNFLRLLEFFERLAYRKAALVTGISQAMVRHFQQLGIAPQKTCFFPNGIDLPNPAHFPARGCFRNRHQIPADRFLVTYSGNIGLKQGLELVVSAAAQIRQPNIHLLFCGEGAALSSLQTQARELKLTNLTFLPLQSEQRYRELLIDSDLCLIPQQAGTGRYFFPSKLLPPLAYARPVLAISDEASELAGLLRESGAGLNLSGATANSIARLLEELADTPERLAQVAKAGVELAHRFDRQSINTAFLARLERLASFKSQAP